MMTEVMRFSGSQTLVDHVECKATVSKIKDLGDLRATGGRLKLALDVAGGDVSFGIVRRGKRLLALELKIGMSRHHQVHMTLNGEQWCTASRSKPLTMWSNMPERNTRRRICGSMLSASTQISDDGMGYDPATARASGGMGLRGMEERVQRLNGKLEILSTSGKGTTWKVEVPA